MKVETEITIKIDALAAQSLLKLLGLSEHDKRGCGLNKQDCAVSSKLWGLINSQVKQTATATAEEEVN